MTNSPRRIVSRYASLPMLSMLLRLCAYGALVFGLFQALTVLLRADGNVSWYGHGSPALNSAFWGFVRFLELLIISEAIHVILDIEQNTRRTADAADGKIAGSTPRNEA